MWLLSSSGDRLQMPQKEKEGESTNWDIYLPQTESSLVKYLSVISGIS